MCFYLLNYIIQTCALDKCPFEKIVYTKMNCKECSSTTQWRLRKNQTRFFFLAMQLNSNRNVAAVSHLSLDPISEEASRSDTTCASEFQDSPMLNYMQLPVPLLEMQPEEEPKEIASQTEIVDGAINQTGLRKKSTPRLCVVLDCTSQARYNERCKRHGGSKPCIVPGCTKTTQTHGLCIRHGGGSRCSYPNWYVVYIYCVYPFNDVVKRRRNRRDFANVMVEVDAVAQRVVRKKCI